jgi:hypothetical protein
MTEITTFKVSDWYEIEDSVAPLSDKTVEEFGPDWFKFAMNGVAVTVRENGAVIACGGIGMYDDETGGVWIKVSQIAAQKPILLVKAIGDSLRIIIESMGAIDIVAHVRDGFTKGERMARFFGFKKTDEYLDRDGRLYVYIYEGK